MESCVRSPRQANATAPAPLLRRRRLTLLGSLAVAYIAVTWGYSWVVTKRAFAYCSPFTFMAIRFTVGGLVLLGALALLRRRITAIPRLGTGLVGGLQTAANFGLVSWAVLTGAVGRSAFFCYLVPLWVAILAWPILGEKPSRGQITAIVVALAGLVTMTTSRGAGGARGDVLAIASGVAWALGVVAAKHLQVRHPTDPFVLAAWQMLVGGIVLCVAAALVPGRPITWSPYLFFAIAYTVVPATVIGWPLWFWVQRKVSAGLASLALLAIPPLVPLLAAVELHENPAPQELVGMALISCALAIVAVLSSRAIETGAIETGDERRDGPGEAASSGHPERTAGDLPPGLNSQRGLPQDDRRHRSSHLLAEAGPERLTRSRT